MWKKWLCFLLAFAIFFTSTNLSVFAQEIQELSASGNNASISENTITKSGPIEDKLVENEQVEITNLLSSSSESGKCGDYLTWKIDGSTLVISGEGAMYDYELDENNNSTAPWISYKSSLTALSLESGITYIGNRAFSGCWEFKNTLTIPDTVTAIGESAFQSCNGFNDISFSTNLKTIGKFGFSGCIGIKEPLKFPEGLERIEYHAFDGCLNIAGDLTIPSSVNYIGSFVFYSCGSLGENLYIKSPSLTIGEKAFWTNTFTTVHGISGTAAEEYATNEGWEFVADEEDKDDENENANGQCGDTLFWELKNGTLTISGTGRMYDYANVEATPWFTYKDKVSKLVFEEGITHVSEFAFQDFTDITGGLSFPQSLESIGQAAFKNCIGLNGTLTFGNSLGAIANFAFEGCIGLTGSLVIPDSVQLIGTHVFYNCSGFNGTLTIGNNVEMLPNSVFENCSGFTGSLVIPNSVAGFGTNAFKNCSGFNGILSIGSSVDIIANSAFENCSGFTGSLVIPDNVSQIGTYVFANCSGFTGDLTIGNNIKTITKGAFENCIGLSGIAYISDSVTFAVDGALNTIKMIYGLSGSYIESYANSNGIKFVAITGQDYSECSIEIYSEFSNCNIGVDQTIVLIPAMVKNGEALKGENGWIFTIENERVAEIQEYTDTEYGPAITLIGKNIGETKLNILHVLTGRSISIVINVVDTTEFFNVTWLEKIEIDRGIYNAGIYMENFKTSRKGEGYEVSFDVYNGVEHYGAVEVYNKDGLLIEVERIDKFEPYQTGLKEVALDFGNLIYTAFNGTISSYKNTMYSKETNIVELWVPDDGYIVISNNMATSMGAHIYNMVDLSIWAVSVGKDAEKALSSSKNKNAIIESTSKNVMKQYIDVVKAELLTDAFKGEYQNKLYKSLEKNVTKDLMADLAGQLVTDSNAFFEELDIDLMKEVKDVAVDYGDGVLVEAFEKVGGPAGVALSGIFKVTEYLNRFMQIAQIVKSKDAKDIKIYIDGNNDKLVSNDVVVENEEGKPIVDNSLVVTDISEDESSQYILESFQNEAKVKILDITMYRDNEEVQPDGKIRVKIPLPENLDKDRCTVYRAESDGTFTNMNAYYEDGFIIFETNHLSKYLIVEKSSNSDSNNSLNDKKEEILDNETYVANFEIENESDIAEENVSKDKDRKEVTSIANISELKDNNKKKGERELTKFELSKVEELDSVKETKKEFSNSLEKEDEDFEKVVVENDDTSNIEWISIVIGTTIVLFGILLVVMFNKNKKSK